MALPTILVNSATGSDTQASGAGPSTALFGTTDASTNGTGLIVTLTAGTDLTNVATDGSHVIFLNDSTAGARNFGKITAKSGSGGATPTVTVADAFGTGLTSKSWAIGGKRASIGSTTSKKLFDNNSGNGDAMPGWIIEMQSGHAETIGAVFGVRRSGDGTNGPITLRGESGAATRPILTFSINNWCFDLLSSARVFQDFDLQNSNATKNASIAFLGDSGSGNSRYKGLKIAHSTNKFYQAFALANGSNRIEDCEIGYCANTGVSAFPDNSLMINCWVHDCGSGGVTYRAGSGGATFDGVLVTGCTGDGFGRASGTAGPVTFRSCTVDSCTGDGIDSATTSDPLWVFNCIFSNNGGYGINTGRTVAGFQGNNWIVRGCVFYNNTSGSMDISGVDENSTTGTNPSYTSTGTGDYSIGTALKAKGYPLGGTLPVGSFSTTYSYIDPGAAQRQEPAASTAPIAGHALILTRASTY